MSLANDLPQEGGPASLNAATNLPESLLARFGDQSQLDFDIEFFDKILLRQPDYVDVLRCQGQLLSRKGLHARALQADQRLVELVPGDGVAHYNLGCSLALMGQVKDAVAALRQALLQGYTDIDYLESDRDLDSLRDEAEYLELMREFGIASKP